MHFRHHENNIYIIFSPDSIIGRWRRRLTTTATDDDDDDDNNNNNSNNKLSNWHSMNSLSLRQTEMFFLFDWDLILFLFLFKLDLYYKLSVL